MTAPALPRPSTATTMAKVVGLLALAYLLYWLPTFYKASQVGTFIRVMTLVLAAMGLNMLTGYTGQISVGHGAFYGIGAYSVAILVGEYEWGHFPALAVGVALSFVVGMAIGIPALRIRGMYLALVTLGLAALFPQLLQRFSDITGGTQGMRVPKFEAPEGSGLANDQWQYYVILVFVVVAFVLVRNVVRSRPGRAMVAIRDNEIAAEVMGVRLSAYKVLVFGISAALAGLGGGLLVFNTNYVSANSFTIELSILILVMVVLGGVATTWGPVIGAVLVVYIPEWLPKDIPLLDVEGSALGPVLFAAVLILLMAVAPDGIMGLARRIKSWALRQRRAPDVPGPGPNDSVPSH